MKYLFLSALFTLTLGQLYAQKIDYKNGLINVDGKDIARVVKIKDKATFGLTSTYELQSLSGEKLIVAAISTEFAESRNDNTSHYYRFSFLPANQVGIFSLGKLTTEKSFARLIGESGIVTNNTLDPEKVKELIARKSSNPIASVEYDLVSRNRMMPVMVRDGEVYQGNVLIGNFKDITGRSGTDTYEFSLPTGLIVAKVTFTGGNNAKNASVTTTKDKRTQTASIASPETTKMVILSPGEDRNFVVLKRIAGWLVSNKYL